MRMLYTAFGPFEGVPENPSEQILNYWRSFMAAGVKNLSVDYRVCPVVYNEVDGMLVGLKGHYDLVLMTGVAPGEHVMWLETLARNARKGRDIEGFGPVDAQPIHPEAPDLTSTYPEVALRMVLSSHKGLCRRSSDAGSYLCNYIYYRMMETLSRENTIMLFVHVADPTAGKEPIPVSRQAVIINRIIESAMAFSSASKPQKSGGLMSSSGSCDN